MKEWQRGQVILEFVFAIIIIIVFLIGVIQLFLTIQDRMILDSAATMSGRSRMVDGDSERVADAIFKGSLPFFWRMFGGELDIQNSGEGIAVSYESRCIFPPLDSLDGKSDGYLSIQSANLDQSQGHDLSLCPKTRVTTSGDNL